VADVVIFGLQDTASLAHFYLRHDSSHRVVGFTVTEEYMPAERSFEGLTVVPFEEVEHHFSPGEVKLFAPMTARRMNRLREATFDQAKAKGYEMVSYVSSKASVFPGAQIGENCFILEDNTIQPFTPIGDNVVLWSGNHIGHHGSIGDHVFFTSHVVLSGHCQVERYCFFGVNATIRDYTRIAEGSLIGMAACIMKDTEPWGVYTGCPARKGEKRSDELDF
jgi:sugar O-acyltransferase (sialic acid O-acetyltransferase NeuD family)